MERTPLYVRLPTPQAERLREAAHRLNISKQDLVSRLVASLDDHRLTVGHAEFRPYDPPDVMTTQQLASWLQVDENTIATLAEQGELPGRKLGAEWRFAREAVVAWLANT
jgi:excisionase family DNA binding protein